MNYRHEWKHVLSYMDYLTIRQRLRAVTELDPHALDGKYHIRSLYFDNPVDKALREKFRIRYYNLDPSVVVLEKKSKLNGLGTKFSAPLLREEGQSIVDGDTDWMLRDERPLVRELYCKMRFQGLRPKTIVDYTREPFIYGPGNVRVTFDYDIRTGLGCTDFLNPDTPMIPAGETPKFLLEVKWDAYLPDIIRDAVQTPGVRVGAFSKYAQCRVYG